MTSAQMKAFAQRGQQCAHGTRRQCVDIRPQTCRRQCSTVCRAQDDNTASSGPTPWYLTFDLRERDTIWTDENKARLVKIVARDEMRITQEEMENRMDVLLTLVPDLKERVSTLRPGLLAALLSVPLDCLADRIVALKDLFPAADISCMLGRAPALLLRTPRDIEESAQKLRELLQTQSVDQLSARNNRLVAQQPECALTPACISEVVAELQRLMPLVDPGSLLVAEPDWVLRAQRGQQWLGQNPDS